MPILHDLTGVRFGKQVARRFVPGTKKTPRRAPKWECDCDCGGVSFVTPENLLNGVSKSCGCLRRRGRTIDETRFAKMDTPDEAYWLGMLATDGNVASKNRPHIKIALKAEDIDHVRAFARFVGCQAEPWVRKRCSSGFAGGEEAGFSFSSRTVADSLASQGIHPNKTWTVRPWAGPEHLLSHYWRGCLDGDGCISLTAESEDFAGRSRVYFCGNSRMVRGFQDFVRRRLGFDGYYCEQDPKGKVALESGHKTGKLSYDGGYRCRKVVQLLGYNDPANVALERKRAVALKIINLPDRYRIVDIPDNELVAKYHELGTWAKVADVFGIDCSTLSHRVHTHGITVGTRPAGCKKKSRAFRGMTLNNLLALKEKHGTWRAVVKELGTSYAYLMHKKRSITQVTVATPS